MLLLLGPAPVSGVTSPKDEKTTVQLIGEDGEGNFTIFLKQTQIGTNDFVFIMDLAVQSNFNFGACIADDSDVPEDDCERDLWLAILFPDGRLFFINLLRGLNLSIQDAGSLNTLPDLPGIKPYLRLGRYSIETLEGDPTNIPPEFDIDPHPSRRNLFVLPQTVVNALPPGQYSIFAGYTTPVKSATNLFDLFAKAVSNVAQYDVIIEEPTVPCGQVQVAGGDTPDFRLIDLGNIAGTFRFDFETFTQEDRITVTHEGQVGFDTGCVGTSGSVFLRYSDSSTKVAVQVFPNCAGGSRTAWNYTVHCPL